MLAQKKEEAMTIWITGGESLVLKLFDVFLTQN